MKRYVLSSLIIVLCILTVSGCHRTRPMQKKPIVYIYSDKKQEVNVKLDFNGTLRATYPLYKTSWTFMADVDGSLTDTKTGEQFQYLFYDGLSNAGYGHFTEGFSVKTDTVIDFLKHKLSYLGLNEKERNDMISFWLPELNEKEFAFIRFRMNNNCNEVSTLKITPRPYVEIRVMLEFLPMDLYIPLEEQKLSPNHRKGFTVVEWGGTNLSNIDLEI